MELPYDTVIDGYHFRITHIKDGYGVEWLDCPDEAYSSRFSCWSVGYLDGIAPVFDNEEIIAGITN